MPKPTRGVPQKAKDTKKALLDLAHYSKKYWWMIVDRKSVV